jgi:3-methyl-2-oxobutanoate hydroxymethyltransferase
MFLFSSDICGESARLPRHARAYGNIAGLRAQIVEERVKALRAFRADVAASDFPSEAETATVDTDELARFVKLLD